MTDRLNAALSGRYTVERELGQGGMATVHLAHDLKHDRRVALKVLRPELAAVIGGERFLAEIRTTANLQHPHILPLFDSGETDGFLYYVMPFVEGESLRRKLDLQRQLGVEEALSIARAAGSALQYAHDRGVVHRDIKPENILLHAGQPVVADFGIALALSAAGGGRLTETGLSLGTPHYMAPEQATADQDASPRSDVYSLACVLYEMLAGDPPHTGPTVQAILVRILTETPRPVTDVRASVPSHVAAALAKALEKLPADRFESVEHFVTALGDAAFVHRVGGQRSTSARPAMEAGEPVSSGVPAGSWRPWLRDSRSWMALGALGVLALSALPRSADEARPVVVRTALDVGDVVPHWQSDIVVSPDGSRFAMTGSVDGELSLWVRAAHEERFRPLPGTANGRYPAFSPDGEWIVYRDFGGSGLHRIPFSGGTPLTVLPPGVVANPLFPSWGEDGNVVFTGGPGRNGDGLYRVPATGGTEPERLTERTDLYFPRQLPGGRGVLATDRTRASTVVWDAETDSVKLLIAEGVDATWLPTGHILYAHPGGGLLAVPFDLEALEVSGGPVPVLEDVVVRDDRAPYAFSTNGTLVYGLGGAAGSADEERLVVRSLTGDEQPLNLAPRRFTYVRWSPDGRSLAFVSGHAGGSQVFVYDVEVGATPRALTAPGEHAYAVWSPDGTRIAYTSDGGGTTDRDIVVQALDEGAPPVRLTSLPGLEQMRDWRVEDVVLFEYQPTLTSSDLWWVGPADGAPTSYLEAEDDLDDPVLSPAGDLLAYQSDVTGQEEVYIRDFPVPGQPTPVSRGSGRFPRWSPDGATLYFWRGTNGPDTLVATRIGRDPTRVLSREAILHGTYDIESWDLHPDGERIVVVEPVGEAQEEARARRFLVVVGWFEELRARLGSDGKR